jgi:hypothetical protein
MLANQSRAQGDISGAHTGHLDQEHRMSKTYEDLLMSAYVGEVWGEHMLARMLEAGTFPTEREHLRLLLALESMTRRTLEVIVTAEGLDPDIASAKDEAESYARKLAMEDDWDAFMRETLGIATEALADFEQLRDLGPDEARQGLVETVEHEEAVIAYASARLDGDETAAAAVVAQHLRKWTEDTSSVV